MRVVADDAHIPIGKASLANTAEMLSSVESHSILLAINLQPLWAIMVALDEVVECNV